MVLRRDIAEFRIPLDETSTLCCVTSLMRLRDLNHTIGTRTGLRTCPTMRRLNGLRYQPSGRPVELLSRVVLRGPGSGGVLQDSVGDDSSFENKNRLVMSVESSPASAGGLSELEHHRETSLPRAAAVRAALPQADRREGALEGLAVRRWPQCSAGMS